MAELIQHYFAENFNHLDAFGWAGQILGLVGLLISCLIFAQRSRTAILGLKLSADVVIAASFLLLSCPEAACLNLIAILREFVFINRGKRKWADHILWLPFFVILCSASTLIAWYVDGFSAEGAYRLLPLIGTSIAVCGLYAKRPVVMRLLMIPSQVFWLIYGVKMFALSNVVNSFLQMLVLVVCLIRYDVIEPRHGPLPVEED